MKIKTRGFGEVEISEKDIITFVKPVLGFEEYKQFVMLMDDEVGNGFAWLQSVEEPELCFVLANPQLLGKEYDPTVDEDSLKALDGKITEKWLMAVIKDDIKDTTVNLKSPVIINTEKFIGAQIVSEDNLPVRYGLFSGKEID